MYVHSALSSRLRAAALSIASAGVAFPLQARRQASHELLALHVAGKAGAAGSQVVRCFEDDNVIHVNNKVDPVNDTDVINFELALADIAQIERRLERLNKKAKSKEEAAQQQACQEQLHGCFLDGLIMLHACISKL